MSIAEQITALSNDRDAIRQAILDKGGTCPSGNGFDDFATDIVTIPSGGQAFAMVLVNYPQNSTLTATNVDGFKDVFPSSSANPQRLYYVSTPSGSTQTCVFTITDNTDPTKTKSKTVSGITIASTQTISLSFSLHLIENGILQIPISNVNFLYSDLFPYTELSFTQQSDSYQIDVTGNFSYAGHSSSAEVNDYILNAFSTLYVDAIGSGNSQIRKCRIYAFENENRPTYANQCPCNVEFSFDTHYTQALDVSSLADKNIKVGIALVKNSFITTLNIYNMWLE